MRQQKNIYIIGNVAFVEHPCQRGHWLKTHPCIAHVACPHCKAKIGEPCASSFGVHLGATHQPRRKAFTRSEKASVISIIAHIAPAS